MRSEQFEIFKTIINISLLISELICSSFGDLDLQAALVIRGGYVPGKYR
jgi:hypothetical protein